MFLKQGRLFKAIVWFILDTFQALDLLKFFIIRGLLTFNFIFCQQVLAETINLAGENFPPQTNQDGTGQQFEVVRAIFEPLGYTIKVNVYPYRRVMYLLENSKVDMAVGLAKVDNTDLLFSEQPHDSDNLVAIFPKNSKVVWQGFNSLLGKRLLFTAGVSEPFLSELYLSSNIDLSSNPISEVSTRVHALNKLLLQRDDFLIDCECSLFLEDVKPYRSQFTAKKIGLTKIYAVFPQTKKSLKLKEIWQREFPKFIKTQAAREIYQKWGLMREYGIIQKVIESHNVSLPSN
jgi:polar amino acid transport system substrate-binding protein